MSCPICRKEHPETIRAALGLLARTPRRLEKLVAALGARAAARPAPEKWSAKEIIHHLSDCEVVYGLRYRKVLAEPGSELAAFDQDAWAEKLDYRRQPLATALASFRALRNHHVALLRSLPRASWKKSALHPEYGALSLEHLVRHLAHHDRSHAAQVERIVSRGAP